MSSIENLNGLVKSLDGYISETFENKVKDKISEIVDEIHERLEDFGYNGKIVDGFYFDDESGMLSVLYTNGDTEEIEEIKLPKDGKDGKDYILTKEDKEEIASRIQVPIVEKIIERTEVIKEQPIITNEIKEVAKYDTAEQIRKKLESLEGEDRIDAKHIKNLPKSQNSKISQLSSLIDVNLRDLQDGQRLSYNKAKGERENVDNSGGGGTRGSITGTLSDQTDLQAELDNKANIQSSSYITNNQNIDVGIVYRVDATGGDIILTLNDGNIEGQILTVKKIDDTDNSVYVNTNSLIDGYDSIEISMQGESYDLYRTGDTFIIR